MRKTWSLFVAVALIASSSAAFAQERNDNAHCAGASNNGENAQNQQFCFGDEIVRDALPRPDTGTVRLAQQHHGPTLIRFREHFVPQMLKSVEAL